NCGGCNIKCALANASSSCVGGQCVIAMCNAGFSNCDGLPADGCEYANGGFTTDPNNCGGCNVKCQPMNGVGACLMGTCQVASCAPGFSDCDGMPGDGCEYANAGFGTDPMNCGGCGVVCNLPNATAKCTGGSCGIAMCAPGHVDLDGNAAN